MKISTSLTFSGGSGVPPPAALLFLGASRLTPVFFFLFGGGGNLIKTECGEDKMGEDRTLLIPSSWNLPMEQEGQTPSEAASAGPLPPAW